MLRLKMTLKPQNKGSAMKRVTLYNPQGDIINCYADSAVRLKSLGWSEDAPKSQSKTKKSETKPAQTLTKED